MPKKPNPKKKIRISEEFLRSKGFTRGPDGIFRKEGCPHPHPPSGADAEPVEGEPKRRKRAQSKAEPVCRFVAIVTCYTVRSRDYDGLGAASKHYLDALRHCGMFPDDSREHLEVLAVSEPVSSFSEEKTTIEIWKIDP